MSPVLLNDLVLVTLLSASTEYLEFEQVGLFIHIVKRITNVKKNTPLRANRDMS